MKNKIVLMLMSISLLSCVMNDISDKHEVITLRENMEGRNIEFVIKAGSEYSSKMQAGPFIFNVIPQTVIWTEDESGVLIETIYISGADYKEMRHGGKGRGEKFYEECFPVWSSKIKKKGMHLPSKENAYPDSITSATPSSGFTLKTKATDEEKVATIFLEINKSADENEFYTKEKNDWIGQPSLIYSVNKDALKTGAAVKMKVIGCGGTLESTPHICEDLSKIDTALNILESVEVTLR